MLGLENIKYRYEKGKNVLDGISYSFEPGKVYAIVGNSGAGKTTILSLLAGLDSPTEGKVTFFQEDIKTKGYDYHRKNQISLIFQNYNLIDYMSAIENIQLVNRNASKELLHQVGLTDEEIKRRVTRLSGGQQQRVAIARALAAKTNVILADEPTGNLDEETADEIMNIFLHLAHNEQKCIIIVTHSKKIAKQADVILQLSNKKLKSLK